LNLVINGKGTVWIDDIRLLKAPLKWFAFFIKFWYNLKNF
jgi:hypothetical protein